MLLLPFAILALPVVGLFGIATFQAPRWGHEPALAAPADPAIPLPSGRFWPVATAGEMTSSFGFRMDPVDGHGMQFHQGLDIAAPTGTPVRAAAPGKVVAAGWAGRYGQAVLVDHGDGLETLYAHLSRALVAMDQQVAGGAEIGLVGSTGRSTGPHLHFEVRRSGEAMDPLLFLGEVTTP